MNDIPPKEWLDELAANIEAGYDPKTATVSEKVLASLTKKMHESLVLLYAERDDLVAQRDRVLEEATHWDEAFNEDFTIGTDPHAQFVRNTYKVLEES